MIRQKIQTNCEGTDRKQYHASEIHRGHRSQPPPRPRAGPIFWPEKFPWPSLSQEPFSQLRFSSFPGPWPSAGRYGRSSAGTPSKTTAYEGFWQFLNIPARQGRQTHLWTAGSRLPSIPAYTAAPGNSLRSAKSGPAYIFPGTDSGTTASSAHGGSGTGETSPPPSTHGSYSPPTCMPSGREGRPS